MERAKDDAINAEKAKAFDENQKLCGICQWRSGQLPQPAVA